MGAMLNASFNTAANPYRHWDRTLYENAPLSAGCGRTYASFLTPGAGYLNLATPKPRPVGPFPENVMPVEGLFLALQTLPPSAPSRAADA